MNGDNSHSEVLNILVVDDAVPVAMLLRHVLRTAGYEVTLAANGREAWEACQLTQFDLILTDHQMPEMTGLELCERLRATEAYAETPIVLITAKGFELELPELMKSHGISAVFMKPFGPHEVIETVEACFSTAQRPHAPTSVMRSNSPLTKEVGRSGSAS